MTEQTIRCPKCGADIPLTETLSHQIREDLRKQMEGDIRGREEALALREKALGEESKKLAESKQSIEQQVREKLNTEREALVTQGRKQAEGAMQVVMRDLTAQLTEKDKMLKDAQSQELELRKKARDLEDKAARLDLEVARKLDQEKDKIKRDAIELFSEEHRLKDLDKDKQIADMKKMIEELKRKSEQGPIQTQGEVLEQDLEALLKTKFPMDEIVPVPKGMRGADILQRVYDRGAQFCGAIIWESKRTKGWNDDWIDKLKADQREAKAEVAVIATAILPDGVKSFCQIEGVWVTPINLAGPLAEALRVVLMQVSQSKRSAVGKNEKMEALYAYLSGPEFRQRVEAIVEAFKSLKEDLEKEKRTTLKQWAKREKQLERVLLSTAGMYGDMQGIIGASLPDIKLLEAEEEGGAGEAAVGQDVEE